MLVDIYKTLGESIDFAEEDEAEQIEEEEDTGQPVHHYKEKKKFVMK